MRIIIAEDDDNSRKLLQLSVQRLGHEAVVTRNGGDAWRAFQSDPARIIVSDWYMPELDGLELCQKVRASTNTDYTYFVLLTGHSSTDNHLQAMDQGIDDFLGKPLNVDELKVRLRVAERILAYTTTIKELRTLLPICMYCKRIRDDGDYWHQIEKYLHKHLHTDFSHGICPECKDRVMKEALANLRKPGESNSQ